MFGWFQPRCPVPPEEKGWVDQRTRWLAAQFGLERARSAVVVLPTEEFFPDPYRGTEEDARVMFRRVCGYMGVDPGPLELAFYTEKVLVSPDGCYSHHGAAGLYEDSDWGSRISIETSNLADPVVLVATMAHELGHLLLRGQGRMSAGDADEEKLTDLVTVYLGLGVFTANSHIRSHASHEGLTESWSIRRVGYLGQPMIGYALALFARLRGEDDPPWAAHLCADVRSPFKKGLRYLCKTGDSLFDEKTGSFALLSDDRLPPGFEADR
jgi:hypothetical protein